MVTWLCFGWERKIVMTTITFDTLAFVKRLKAAGFNEDQSEALSEAFKASQETSIKDLATKFDLKDLEIKMDRDFAEIKAEQRLIKWMMGFVLAGIAALILKSFFS